MSSTLFAVIWKGYILASAKMDVGQDGWVNFWCFLSSCFLYKRLTLMTVWLARLPDDKCSKKEVSNKCVVYDTSIMDLKYMYKRNSSKGRSAQQRQVLLHELKDDMKYHRLSGTLCFIRSISKNIPSKRGFFHLHFSHFSPAIICR